MKNRLLLILILILILAGVSALTVFFALGRKEPAEIKASGILEAREVEVRSKIGGKIAKLQIKEGDLVFKDQIIGYIDTPGLTAKRKAAHAKHELALAEWKRMKRLYAQGIISRSNFDKAESALKEAESQRDLINAQILDAVITAPISGTIVSKLAEEGEVIVPALTILSIADLSRIILKIYVTERELGKIRLKDPAYVSTDLYPHETFEGTITFIASRAEFTPKYIQTKKERLTRVFEIKIEIPNPEEELKPGLSADAVIKIH